MKRFFFIVVVAALFASSCNLTSEAIITAGVWAANAECPSDLGDGLTMTQVTKDGNYVMYYCRGDEDQYEFDQSLADGEVRSALLQELKSQALTDDSLSQFFQALKDTRTGIIYHYYTVSGTSMDVVIDYDML